MIKFFRNLRQQLLSENKLSKYLFYAIGEIILVVIGILVALQINNTNDERRNEQKVHNLLAKIQTNIDTDLERIDWLLDKYYQRDSVGWLVLLDKVTKEDYENPNSILLHSLVYSYDQINLKKQSYENLINQQDIISSEYDLIMDNLSTLYIDLYDFVLVSENQLKEYVIRLNEEAVKEYEWYSDMKPSNLNSKKINFHLNDSTYKGMVKLNQQRTMGDYLNFILLYREQAMKIYKMIDAKLNSNGYINKLAQYGLNDSTFVGTYRLLNGNTIGTYMHNDFLYTTINNDTTMLHRHSDHHYAGTRGFLRFETQRDSVLIYVNVFEAGRTPLGLKINE